MAKAGLRSMASPRILPSSRDLSSAVNSFAVLCSTDELVAEDPTAVDDPKATGLGDPVPAADPLGSANGFPTVGDDSFGEGAADPLAFDDPLAADPTFDDPIVPMASSSVLPAGNSSISASSPSIIGNKISWKDVVHHTPHFSKAPVMPDLREVSIRGSISRSARLLCSSASGGDATASSPASIRVDEDASKERRGVSGSHFISVVDASGVPSDAVRVTCSSSTGFAHDSLGPIPMANLGSAGGSGGGTPLVGDDEPSSPSSNSSTPMLARRLNLVDELEKKHGKRIKQRKKKKNGSGNSRG